MKNNKKGIKIEITWNDTFSDPAWWHADSVKEKIKTMPYLNTSTGYFVTENETWLVIATSRCSVQDSWGDVNYIPKGCIISRKFING